MILAPPTERRTTARVAALATALAAVWTLAPAPTMARDGVTFTLGAGARLAPEYFGASSMEPGPTGRFSLQHLSIGGLQVGRPDARPLDPGFGIGGAFRYIGSRGPGQNPELAGLDRVDASVELGLGLRHVAEGWRVFADLRHGVIGHGGWAGDLGADALLRLGPDLILTAGPRVAFGDARFTRTYFGVTPAESAASGFAAYRPSGGLVSVGAELGMHYALDADWGLVGTISYDHLRGDAADSPVTTQGSRDQWGASLVVTRRFNLRF